MQYLCLSMTSGSSIIIVPKCSFLQRYLNFTAGLLALSLSLSTYTCIYIYRDYMFWFHPLQNISITASRRLSGNHSKSTVNSSPNWGWHYWINISHLWMYTKHSRIISYCTIVSSVYFMSIWLNHSIASYISIDFKYSTIADNSKFFMIQYDTSWF